MVAGLGFVRFYLASVVMLAHLGHFWRSDELERVGAGIYGVTLFFVLSGFLVTNMIARNRFDERPHSFTINRALRIFPTYFFVMACALLFVPEAQEHLRNQAALYRLLLLDKVDGFPPLILEIANAWGVAWSYALLLFRNTNAYWAGDWNPVLWTIDIELRAYLLMAILLYTAPRWKRSAGPLTLLLLCIALACAIDVLSVCMSPMTAGALVKNRDPAVLLLPVTNAGGLLYFLPFFLIGAILALLPRFAEHRRLLAAMLAVSACAAVALYWNYLRIQTRVAPDMRLTATFLFGATLVFIVAFILCQPEKPRPIVRQADTLLGNMSYPLYLFNFPVALWIAAGARIEGTQYMLGVVLTVALSALCLLIVDEPVRRIRVRLTESRGHPLPHSSPVPLRP